MSERNDGGPAFPIPGEVWHADGDTFKDRAFAGMTLRDYFAAKAMQAIVQAVSAGQHDAGALASKVGGSVESRISADAYEMADAMLKAR